MFVLGLVLLGSGMAGLGALVALWLVFGPWWLGGAEERGYLGMTGIDLASATDILDRPGW